MTIDITGYTTTHGHKPRGHGNWVFMIVRYTNGGHPMTNHSQTCDTYSQAVANLKKHAAYPRATSVVLLP